MVLKCTGYLGLVLLNLLSVRFLQSFQVDVCELTSRASIFLGQDPY